ncbi:MAG: DUF2218 domain-containing protein [Maritimibacter sp.]
MSILLAVAITVYHLHEHALNGANCQGSLAGQNAAKACGNGKKVYSDKNSRIYRKDRYMVTSEAFLPTEHGSKYLQQLCKHFGHKTEVEFTPTEGRVALRSGPAVMKADEKGLWIQVSVEDEAGIPVAQDVIDRHLARFAFREEFEHMPWPAA